MIIVGLTGGIGSGKTTVAKMFSELGIAIYIADTEAKRLMDTSKVIKRKLIALFGSDAYNANGLNKTFIASKKVSQCKAITIPADAKINSCFAVIFKGFFL